MTMIQILYLVIIFIAVAGGVFGLMRLLTPDPVQSRLDQIASEYATSALNESNPWEEVANKLTSPFASLSLPSEGWESSPLRTLFMHAGYRSQSVPFFYFGGKTLLAMLVPGIFLLYAGISGLELNNDASLIVFLALVTAGYYLPNVVLTYVIKIRQRDLFENFPDAIDLMTVCVEAGLGLDAAMRKVGEEMYVKCKPLSEELHLVNLEMRAGRSRDQALRNLALRTGVEEIEGLVAMLIQADRFGTSIASSLRVHSDMLRTKRRLRAEEAAAKIALKLLFPLILFILPTLLVVMVGPAIIGVSKTLLPTLSGS
ncbi:type II secretion system F family protein [Nitrosomonas sp. Is24]|uniref:type II secretion system F family protein n=1 Tax=Nitrosomonas sp. Is24 TaxID=3080533 RepID=UPI00294B60BE|nr:type II secretion system F family protein [Nitrosomonas sp. Is24]MDV6342313.1 type II secretion system F family protein [Nitrosomonas sp. Is24]